jgi:phospholipase/lecithinase/hemolysin
MILSSKSIRRCQRAMAAALAFGAAALIGACGGGTSQFEPFVAQRIFVFGDDHSAMNADGRRYGINGLAVTVSGSTTTSTFDCTLNPVWIQNVAALYGLVFAECPPATPPSEFKAFNRAAKDATVAAVAAQVEAQRTRPGFGGFGEKDLVLMMAGIHDVLELYRQYPTRDEASLIAEAGQRGRDMAAVVNRVVELGAKVIVSNLPDMGLSPYARKEAAANAASGFDRAAFVTRLTNAFNEQLGVRVLLDGRFVGLAQTDLRSQAIGRSPLSFGFVNISDGFCSVAPPACTTSDAAVTGAVATQYLWADDTRLSAAGQSIIGALAVDRAQRNPF